MKKWVVAPEGQWGEFTDADGYALTLTSSEGAVAFRIKHGLCIFSASVTRDIARFLVETMLREVDDMTPGQAAYERYAMGRKTVSWDGLSEEMHRTWEEIASAARRAEG